MLKLTHAKHDTVHCLAPGLFRSLKKGDRKKLKLDITHQLGPNEHIEFKGPEPLGVDDMRVLQGLIAMGGPDGKRLGPDPTTFEGVELRKRLAFTRDDEDQEALFVKGSFRSLAREIGYSHVDDARSIRESIERLYTVSIFVQKESVRLGFRLLALYGSDDISGKLCIALNPRLAYAIVGNGQHVRIELAEVRRLKSDPARLLHQRLCGVVNQGKSNRFKISTLCGYIWHEDASKSAMKSRRYKVRKALKELVEIGWTIDEVGENNFKIVRPAQHK